MGAGLPKCIRAGQAHSVSRKPGGDHVPDRVGELFLAAARDVRDRSVGRQDQGLVVFGAEREPAAHLVDDEQVTAFAGQLGAAVAGQVLGLGGEADDDLARMAAVGGQLAQHIRILGELNRLRARLRSS